MKNKHGITGARCLVLLFLYGLCLNSAESAFAQFTYSYIVYSVAFSPDGKQVLFITVLNEIKLWDATTGLVKNFSGHTEHVSSVAFSPDGKQILSGSWDKNVKLWDIATGKEIKNFLGHTEWVNSVAFSPDGKQILSGSNDNTVKLWDIASERDIRTFKGHTGSVNSVAFSPDGKQILSGSNDYTMKLWDTASGRVLRTFKGHTNYVTSVAFSSDGKQILSGSYDDTVKLWNTANGRVLKTFEGHTEWVNSVAFSPDGRQVLSGSNDDTVKLWDVASGREIRTFKGNTDDVNSVTFNPDGKQVFCGSRNGLKLWDIASGVEAHLQRIPEPVRVTTTTKPAANNASKPVVSPPQTVTPKPAVPQAAAPQAVVNIPPTVVIRSPENGSGLTTNRTELSVVVDNRQQSVMTIKVLVNGKQVGGEAISGGISGTRGGDLEVENTQIRLTGNRNRVEFKLPVTLDPGTNRIEVIAANNPASEGRETIEVTYSPAASGKTSIQNLELVAAENLGNQARIGKQYALFIAVDAYRYWGALKEPVSDAGKIRDILQKDYFMDETIELYNQNATKEKIVETFENLQDKLGVHDSLFIYYAGHGHLDNASKQGYWIPVDGGINTRTKEKWLPNNEIRGYIAGFKTIHVFMVSDSCFSGDILNTTRSMSPVIDNAYYRKAYALTSRQVLTSGSSEKVDDQSEFSAALINCLRKNTSPLLDPIGIYNDVRLSVSKTTPLYGTLNASSHQDGATFLFFRRQQAVAPER